MTINPDAVRKAREAARLSQDELAALSGTGQSTIDKIERGVTRSSKFLSRIASALNVPIGELDTDFADEKPKEGYRAPVEFFGDRDFKIFAAVEGGPGSMVVGTDPIEIVQRPWYMREVKDGYGVLITGDSMDPAFRPGDIAVINPKLPVLRGKNAIFVNGEEQGGFRATIKELRTYDANAWHVLQHNPPAGMSKEFSLDRKEWPKALRVVGKFEG